MYENTRGSDIFVGEFYYIACLVLLTNVLSKCTRTRNLFCQIFYFIKKIMSLYIYFFNLIVISSLILLIYLLTSFIVKLILLVKIICYIFL